MVLRMLSSASALSTRPSTRPPCCCSCSIEMSSTVLVLTETGGTPATKVLIWLERKILKHLHKFKSKLKLIFCINLLMPTDVWKISIWLMPTDIFSHSRTETCTTLSANNGRLSIFSLKKLPIYIQPQISPSSHAIFLYIFLLPPYSYKGWVTMATLHLKQTFTEIQQLTYLIHGILFINF